MALKSIDLLNLFYILLHCTEWKNNQCRTASLAYCANLKWNEWYEITLGLYDQVVKAFF